MFAKILIYFVFAFISQLLTYKIMKKIDKREREKLKKWEDDYIEELIAHREKLRNMPKIDEELAAGDATE